MAVVVNMVISFEFRDDVAQVPRPLERSRVALDSFTECVCPSTNVWIVATSIWDSPAASQLRQAVAQDPSLAIHRATREVVITVR